MSSSGSTTNEYIGYTRDSTGTSDRREYDSSQATPNDYASYTNPSPSDQASNSHITSNNTSQTSMYSGGAIQDSYTDSSACLTPSTDNHPSTAHSQPKPNTITASGTKSQVRPPPSPYHTRAKNNSLLTNSHRATTTATATTAPTSAIRTLTTTRTSMAHTTTPIPTASPQAQHPF